MSFKAKKIVVETELKVGMGVTHSVGSDSYPFTIVEVISPKKIVVQQDNVVHVSGSFMKGDAKYRYEPNDLAEKKILSLRKNGRWYPVGQKDWHCAFFLGSRSYYQDPSF